MTTFLTDDDVRAVFDWPEAVTALRAAYAAAADEAGLPPRTMARGEGVWLRTLTGVLPGAGVMGGKMIAASMHSRGASYLIPLFDQRTTELLALLDGNAVTGFRTAATSALAADLLAPPGSLRVGVIGSGFEAQHHVRALAAIRELAEVRVFSPNPASRARFAERLADLDVPPVAVDSAPEAVAGVDLVVCAARARGERPTLLGAWLEPGMTVVSIGSTLPEQRELDADAIARADLIVADHVDEVAHDTGDMIAAKEAGVVFADRLVPLGDVVAGRVPARPSPDAVVLYKSVGTALQDLAVAVMCVRRAAESQVGTPLPVTIRPVAKG
ncbi:ornithine cyclodeaminase family protein [Streptomyces spongiae]|uniref:Ornithine cyclodeaminase family protein n=1 Tax=Streptomyces spongiae TaxID=565072 RepID=A0A5N8XSX7_9ACTN|nr:ornithine cyclodeaminase family protein [Streptomyces spongiae]MPY61715.1 ornithine cyclodeaminase family protein [Streptomyces spongiae]